MLSEGDLAGIRGFRIVVMMRRRFHPGVRARIVAMKLGTSNEWSEGMGRKVNA